MNIIFEDFIENNERRLSSIASGENWAKKIKLEKVTTSEIVYFQENKNIENTKYIDVSFPFFHGLFFNHLNKFQSLDNAFEKLIFLGSYTFCKRLNYQTALLWRRTIVGSRLRLQDALDKRSLYGNVHFAHDWNKTTIRELDEEIDKLIETCRQTYRFALSTGYFMTVSSPTPEGAWKKILIEHKIAKNKKEHAHRNFFTVPMLLDVFKRDNIEKQSKNN